ncbi:hypothetical protein [Ohtaekwangia koreensis]|uniref:Outer membrane protein beta-barrel domain-containing protein n=1 Tax=Ohtaekwangia koreensis TaxID=688867 RepID=A0A1T5K4B8_9BACT|nr:hypothetical protein [Ohtaekwangia koreensis]SKC58503.1 hypothetical protein SAMN05660236_1804 [Ohtaekwangia koreensis]
MRKNSILAIIMLIAGTVQAQQFGLSFSYFIPKNGYFSTPISPFSIRGLGFDINRFVALETGASLYRMSGLNMKDLPFESKDPLIGPNFTIFVPVELVFQLKGQSVEFDIKGGVFGFHGFGQRINYGNFDRAIRSYEGWLVANSDLNFKNKPGWGYHGGAELTVYVTDQVGVSIETNYLVGESKFPLKGSYTGGNTTLETKPVDYADAKIDFTGLEFSIGLIFNSGGGPSAPKKMKRRRR